MKLFKTSYEDTNCFSNLFLDYINNKKELSDFYNNFPNLSNFEKQINLKKTQKIDRELLFERINFQYSNISSSIKVKENINLIKNENCFTVSTGHQLCLFSGPLFFIYKIISTINLAKMLKQKYNQYEFVPIFILASEDHDFKEVSKVNILNREFEWSYKHDKETIGSLSCDNLDILINEIENHVTEDETSKNLIELLRKCFVKHDSYSDAFRCFLNYLFEKLGLVVLDINDSFLKKKCKYIIEKDVIESYNFDSIVNSSKELNILGYNSQAFARKINFFYIDKFNKRHRILNEGKYYDIGSEKISKDDLINRISNNTDKFSSNVLLTPLIKEYLMPNIGVVCGPSEISYWMQLKETFNSNKIVFPILVPRNSVLFINNFLSDKITKLKLNLDDLFLDTDSLIKKWLNDQIKLEELISDNKQELNKQYDIMFNKIKNIDISLSVFVEREKAKNKKNLLIFDKTLLKHFKNRNDVSVNQIKKIKNKLFPENNLQERYENFISLYLNDADFIYNIAKFLNPLDFNFLILKNEK